MCVIFIMWPKYRMCERGIDLKSNPCLSNVNQTIKIEREREREKNPNSGTWLITLMIILFYLVIGKRINRFVQCIRSLNVSVFVGHVFPSVFNLPELPTHDRLQSIQVESQSIQKSRFLRLLNRMMPKNSGGKRNRTKKKKS